MAVTVERNIKKNTIKIRSLERKVRELEKQNEILIKHVTRLVGIAGQATRDAKRNRSDISKLLQFRAPVQALVHSLKPKHKIHDFKGWKDWMRRHFAQTGVNRRKILQ